VKRVLLSRASQNQERSHHRHVPAGTSFARWQAGVRFVDYAIWAAISFDDHLNSVPSTHMRCRMTASFRATATLALRKLLRLATRIPQDLSADHFATRVSQHVGCLVKVASQHCVATFRDASGPIDLARGVSSGRQPGIGSNTSRFLEPGWVVNCRLIAQRSDRPHTGHSHEAAHLNVIARTSASLCGRGPQFDAR
jgi:hypothetical protein